MAETMPGLSLSGITKCFGKHPILREVTLEVKNGELLVIVGPSGCGKTTLLRTIAGLEEPDAGTIHISGRDVTELEPRERNVAMVFQSYALYPHLTVRDNMAFSLKIRKAAKDEVERRILETSEMLGISNLLDRYPKQLSGGEQQRVAMGRALVREPEVYLFDEPLSNLDAQLRTVMRTEIKRIQRAVGATTLYVTHDQTEALTMADRIAVMREGRLVQIGTPRSVYSQPMDVFVATFIGSPPMNLFEGAVSRSTFCCPAGRISLPEVEAARQTGAEVGQAMWLGLRPDDVEIVGGGARLNGEDALPGRVELIEPIGRQSYVIVDHSGVRGTWLSSMELEPDDLVSVRPLPGRARLFDHAGLAIIGDSELGQLTGSLKPRGRHHGHSPEEGDQRRLHERRSEKV